MSFVRIRARIALESWTRIIVASGISMKSIFRLFAAAAAIALNCFGAEKQIQALIITGGCCHNYAFQSQAITQAVGKGADVKWTILQDPRTGTRGEIDLYKDAHWADPYDVIIHNECFAE